MMGFLVRGKQGRAICFDVRIFKGSVVKMELPHASLCVVGWGLDVRIVVGSLAGASLWCSKL